MILWKQHTGFANAIQAMNRPRFFVEQQITVQVLAIRQNPHQNQWTDDGVKNFRIVECLIRICDGVVLDLDGEVTADRFHKNTILDGDVRMLPRALHVAMGAFPLELYGIRESAFVVETIADIFERAITTREPFERFEIILATADAHFHMHVRTDDHEFHEQCALVELEQRNEVLLESSVAQDVGNRQLVKLIFLIQPE